MSLTMLLTVVTFRNTQSVTLHPSTPNFLEKSPYLRMSHACSEGTKEEELIEQCVQMFGQIKQIGIMNLPTGSNTKTPKSSQIDL